MCHKKSSRLVSVILCILIFSFCLCSDAFIATAIEINEDGKPVCVATIDDSFSLNEIILVIMPNYASKNYTTSDFSDVNCTNIEELIWNNANSSYNRVIKLTIQSSSKSDVIAAIRVLEQRTDIYSADPNYFDIVQVADNNDAYTTNAQWSMNNISLPEVLDCSFSSEEIYVGVIDTGIDVANPTLNALVDTTLSLSFSPDYTIGTQDLQGHGTHVAGIIGAQVTNTVDKNEMYPNVKIVSLRVGGSSGQIYLWGVLSALNYAEACGIQILNFSAGGVFPLPITIA